MIGRIVPAVALAVAAACSPVGGGSPEEATTRALSRLIAHDVAGGKAELCRAAQIAADVPLLISGLFAPVGGLPGFDIPRTLALIEFDASRLTVTEVSRTGDEAEVLIEGTLVERFDPVEVEALFRAYAAESNQQVEQALLDETIANVSSGDVVLPVDETVRVVREDGAWKVCPPAPTP